MMKRMGLVKAGLLCAAIMLLSGNVSMATCPVGDLDGDCRVNFVDLIGFSSQWLNPGCTDSPCADLNDDETVDMFDYALMSGHWQEEGQLLVINELMAVNTKTKADKDGDYSDWIEILNVSSQDVNLEGWHLTDDEDTLDIWTFPAVTLSSGQYLVVFASEKNLTNPASELHTNFKLGSDGDYLALVRADGTVEDKISPCYPSQLADVSYGRITSGQVTTWEYMTTPTPGAANVAGVAGVVATVDFSVGRGFYTATQTVALSCSTTDATIHYTTDGSTPTATTGTVYTSGTPISVTKTTCIRAAAFKTGWLGSAVTTHTYLFIADIVANSPESTPTGWTTGPVNGQVLDYGLDSTILSATDSDFSSQTYRALMPTALTAIPTISIVTDLSNLFSSTTGIYTHASSSGISWERPVSVELLNPDGSTGFQINAGARIRGSTSASGSNPKHGFRLFFRSEYGKGKLEYSLFGTEGASQFERVDLRCDQNNSWHYQQGSTSALYCREVFPRDLMREMGQPYTRSRYYHLYINGVYWGMYMTEERPDPDFAASYMGGDAADYDQMKSENYTMVANEGTTAAYNRLWTQASLGFSGSPGEDGYIRYYKVQGMNPDGTTNSSYERLLDVDNVIAYMLSVYYTNSVDGPLHPQGTSVNNVYALYNRVTPDGFKFLVHDNEWGLVASQASADRTTITTVGSTFAQFNPQWLHQQLAAQPEYRIRFADMVQKYFYNGGALSPTGAQALFDVRKSQINTAIIGESARWGDYVMNPVAKRRTTWTSAISTMATSWFPNRTATVVSQFKTRGWFPTVSAPTLSQYGGQVASGYALTMTATAGTIWYTTDGTDPRLQGSSVNSTATSGTSLTISRPTRLKARALSSGTWSPLIDVMFTISGDAVSSSLRITEIMYHPADDPNDEFIELKNIGTQSLNLDWVKFTTGITYTFAPNTTLAAGSYIVVVKDRTLFTARYGTSVNLASGQWTGALDNGGECIVLTDAGGNVIHNFSYDDGWYDITDGGGFSLTAIDPTDTTLSDWGLKTGWRPSAAVGGSPGAGDDGVVPNPGSVVINEVLAHSNDEEPDWIELYNTTSSPINIGGWFLSDSDANDTVLKKFRIPLGTSVPALGYLVFYEDIDFNNASNSNSLIQFALSENGDMVVLSSAQSDVLTGYRVTEDFGASDRDVTLGRYVTSTGDDNFVAMATATPGAANSAPVVGPIVINEIMYHPTSSQLEYIELKNIGSSPVTLQTYDEDLGVYVPWQFTDGIDFVFPLNTTIPAGGCLIVANTTGSSPATEFRTVYPSTPSDVTIVGPFANSTNLSNAGEKVQLGRPGDIDGSVRQYIRVDRVVYSDGSHPATTGGTDPWPTSPDGSGKALERKTADAYGNDVANWQAAEPTPGQ
jgi:hypothetical protein